MAKVNITEAARLAGMGRQHLYRAYINTGKISVERDVQNRPVIDTSELLRVFGALHGTGYETQSGQADIQDNGMGYSELKAYLVAKDELVSSLRDQLKEASEREEWLRRQLERAQAVLTDQRAVAKKSWWRFW